MTPVDFSTLLCVVYCPGFVAAGAGDAGNVGALVGGPEQLDGVSGYGRAFDCFGDRAWNGDDADDRNRGRAGDADAVRAE